MINTQVVTKGEVLEVKTSFTAALSSARQELDMMECNDSPEWLRGISNAVQVDSKNLFSRRNRVAVEDLETTEGVRQEYIRANAIINQIPLRIELERKYGQNFALIMNLTPADYAGPGGSEIHGQVEPQWLQGAAREVWTYLKTYGEQIGLKPTLEYWDDITNRYSGHFIGVEILSETQGKIDHTNNNLADFIIEQIPLRATLQALRGSKYAVVMSLDPEKDLTSNIERLPGTAEPEDLRGTANKVFSYCQSHGLSPDLQYWSNAELGTEGFNIVIHWHEEWKIADKPVIDFHASEGPFRVLSNFAEYGFEAFGRTWKSVEHFFQAMKFIDTDPAWVDTISRESSPLNASKLGRSRSHTMRSDWEKVKVDVMAYALMAKALANQDVRDKLLATGDSTLVERNLKDPFWGVSADGDGQNVMGGLWMEIRTLLRDNPGEAKTFMETKKKSFIIEG